MTDKELRKKVKVTFKYGKVWSVGFMLFLLITAIVSMLGAIFGIIMFIVEQEEGWYVCLTLVFFSVCFAVVYGGLKYRMSQIKKMTFDAVPIKVKVEKVHGLIRITFKYDKRLYKRTYTKESMSGLSLARPRDFKNYIGKTVDGYFSPTYNEVMIARQDMVKKMNSE